MLYCSRKCLLPTGKEKMNITQETPMEETAADHNTSPSEYDDPCSALYIDPIYRSGDGLMTGIRLSRMGNTVSFSQEDISNSIGSYYKESALLTFTIPHILTLLITHLNLIGQMATDREANFSFIVFARGPTGPYDVRTPIEVAAELLLTKELEVMQIEKDTNTLTFTVTQLTQLGDKPFGG